MTDEQALDHARTYARQLRDAESAYRAAAVMIARNPSSMARDATIQADGFGRMADMMERLIDMATRKGAATCGVNEST